MTNDTKNALTDFNLCLALSQEAINNQMEDAWKAWKYNKQFQDTIKIFKIKKEGGQIVDSKYGLEAKIAPLTISLNVESSKLGQVKVTLHLQSGEVVYYDEANECKANSKIENWSVSFITDLDKKSVDLDALASIAPDVHRTAKEAIEKSGLPDDVFSIEYLFLKFTKVDLLLSDNKNINIPDSVSGAARNKALSCLNLLLQGELGDFMLGTVVRRNNKQDTPTFALTDFIFHVHSDWSVPDASTLSYLGMLANQPMPADKDSARILLKDAWVSPEMINAKAGSFSGIMAISKQVFMDKYLIPKFTKSLTKSLKEVSLEYNGLTWTFKHEPKPQQWQTSYPAILPPVNTIDCKYETANSYWLTLTINPGIPQIKLSGQINSHAFYDGYPALGQWGISTGVHIPLRVSWVHCKGHQDISGTLTLMGKGISTDFQIDCKLDHSFSCIHVDEGATEGMAKLTNGIETVLEDLKIIGSTYEEKLQNQQKSLAEELKSLLDGELQQLQLDVSQHAFIPPGGGVFNFQNPRFSQAGDLIFDVMYEKP